MRLVALSMCLLAAACSQAAGFPDLPDVGVARGSIANRGDEGRRLAAVQGRHLGDDEGSLYSAGNPRDPF